MEVLSETSVMDSSTAVMPPLKDRMYDGMLTEKFVLLGFEEPSSKSDAMLSSNDTNKSLFVVTAMF